MDLREVEEILESLWICQEKNEQILDSVRQRCHGPVSDELLAILEKEELIAHNGEMIFLKPRGKEQAAAVVRRHRLAERLLSDVLNLSSWEVESNACKFEHMLAPEVTESICTLLGHPRECPHGTAIPEGRCCHEARHIVENVVISLTQLKVGDCARMAYIKTKSHPQLHKLLSFGIRPGVSLKVHQKYPSFVISCEQSELAVEKEIAEDIFVWRETTPDFANSLSAKS